jgi:ABC-2 type transport system permease protein
MREQHNALALTSALSQRQRESGPLSLLARVHLQSAWRRLKSLREQSRLLTAVILTFISSYLVLAFLLFYKGLEFIARFPGLGTVLTERLLFLLFAFLFVLLLLSNLVIGYTNLFRNRETSFLLTLPIRRETIFQWKFIESTLLASWAFLFLIAPLLAAYGLIRGVPWHFYLLTPVLVALFIVLPAVAGSFLAVTVARHLDRKLFQIIAVATLVAVITGAALWFRPDHTDPAASETRVLVVLDKMLEKTHFAHYPLLPSMWLSSSVLQWAEGARGSAVFFVAVLLSHVLFFGMLACTRMGNLFYDAASTVQSRGSVFGRWGWSHALAQRRKSQRPRGPGPVERLVNSLPVLKDDTRALIVKDTRMFWRDTTQWAQSVMLFGLLGVYIFNLRHFSQQLSNPFWIHLVSYLNLGACALNLATLTTRFVYPQFSLEGKRLWIIGMAPLGMVRVVKTKFWLATVTSLVMTLGLMLLSCYMLDLPARRVMHFGAAVTVMTLTLTGLAIGLGVLYPNFKEDNPSKIVSGFGGTFCLVLSFLYILVSVILLAFTTPWTPSGRVASTHAWLCLAAFAGLSILLGWIPLRLGLRRVRTVEF